MINHRYNVLRKLGEGGSGEVFLVEDSLKQRQQLAMKILHPADSSDDSADEQFRNEVSVLATLHHPNLVRMFDFGVVHHATEPAQKGRRFFTMEHLEGQNALQWCQSLRSDEERVIHIGHILLQTLGVLSYIHRQGILHFDIKPENLLLIPAAGEEGGLPLMKLVDFGFSVKQEHPLDLPLRGTVEYTAPELLRHEAFDHRIDLYSLGATLFHLIEDRCPFEARDPVELIKKVLTTQPDFQRSSQEIYSQFVLLMRNLLEKDPARRFPSAKEAARPLLSAGQQSNILPFELAVKPLFVDREKEKEQIGSAIALLERGRGDMGVVAFAITGPEGIGKTALLTELVRYAKTKDIPVLEVSITQRDVPFGSIRSLLLLLRAEVLSRSEDGQLLAAKHIDVIDGGLGQNAMKLQGEWMQEREKVIEAQARFIHQSSFLFPFMIVVDNADQLDAESAAVLRVASRDAQPGRFLLLASERGDGNVLGLVRRIQLGELEAGNVSEMATSVLSSTMVGEAIGSRVYQLYGGSPYLIVEVLHSAGILLPADLPAESSAMSGLVESVIHRLPRDIDQFLLNRYKSVNRGLQLTLDILSFFETPVNLELLQALLPFQRQRTSEYVSSLEADGLIILHEDGRRCSMRHEKLKTIIYSALNQNRQDVHFFIASTMESFLRLWSFSDLQEVAYQYIEGGRPAEGIRWLEKAGDEAMRIAAYRRAKELYNKAALLVSDSGAEQLNRFRVKLARATLDSGEYREAIYKANELLKGDSLEDTLELTLHKIAGLAQSRLGEFEDSKKHISRALVCSTDEKEKLELQQELVGIDIALGNYSDAERTSLTQLDHARHLEGQLVVASIYTDLGITTFLQDLFDRSVGYFQEAMRIYSDSKKYAYLADAMMNVGNVMSAKGDIVTAIDYWNKSLALSLEYGTLNQQAQIKNNLGIAHYKLRRYDEAKTFYGDARNIFARIESKQGTTFVLTNLGDACFAECEYEKALVAWGEALASYREMDDARGLLETILQLAQVRLVLGDRDLAARGLDEAEALMSERSLETFRAQLHFHRGTLMMLMDNLEEARKLFTAATSSLQEGAETERKLLLMIRRAECDYRSGNYKQAVPLAQEALQCAEKDSKPQIVGEASLLLGMIAKISSQNVSEKALMCLKRGMEAIAKEPITELTWKLAFALGREFHERGQREKAKECFLKAMVVLQFILGQFKSPELKKKYLVAEGKDKVLLALDSFLQM